MPGTREIKAKLAAGLKWLKGIGALLLLLALPTYSYWDFSAQRFGQGSGALFWQQESQPERGGSRLESVQWQQASQPSRGQGSSEKPNSSNLDLAGRFASGRAAGLIPEELRNAPVGVPSSLNSAGFVHRGRGRSSSFRSVTKTIEMNGLQSLDAAESEALGQMVARATRASGLDNPFLSALQEREGRNGDPSDPANPTPLENDSQQQDPSAPSVEEGAEPADGGAEAGDDVAPVDDQKERREEPEPDTNTPPESNGEPDPNQDSSNDETPSDESPPDEGNQDPQQNPDSDPASPPSSSYNFLIIPEPDPRDQGRRVFLARRDEQDEDRFNLEDGTAFFFPQSLVPSSVGLNDNQLFATSDFNSDGLLDLVRVRNEAGFCSLEVFLKDPLRPNGYNAIDAQLPDQSVRSFALMDFDLDDVLDMAVLFDGASELFVFRLDIQAGALRLLETRQFPFKPALVIDWQFIHTGGWPERVLYVLDETFSQAAAASSFEPDKIVQVSQVPSFRSLRVSWPSQGGAPVETEVLVFESQDRITMVEAGRSGYRLYALFDTSFFSPVAVMGDFQGVGTRQLLVLP